MSTQEPTIAASAPQAGWSDLLGGKNAAYTTILAGGVTLHAINIFIVTTILPSVVRSIGGLEYYAWATTLFVVASILGAALSPRLLDRVGAGRAYASATVLFVVGTLICATAPAFLLLLAGRFVQGLGGGFLLTLAYAVVRLVYPEVLWSRAIGLISAMWGVSTLIGPAVGGIFAELNIWRAAFWALVPVSVVFGTLAIAVLPKGSRNAVEPSPLPLPQLALLTASVVAVSAGSISVSPLWNGAGLLIAALMAALLVRVERAARARLLPKGALDTDRRLVALFATIALLVTGTQTEVFIPYFLQVLHGQSPLIAGYLAALMAMGWTLGSMLSAGRSGAAEIRAIRTSPILLLAGLLVLLFSVPVPGSAGWHLIPICVGLLLAGLGIGVGWPHLVTNVFREAPASELGLAAGAITTVQLYATAFGAAAAGMVANAGGLNDPGGAEGAASAALLLFGAFLAAPALGLVSVLRLAGKPKLASQAEAA
ncbi:MFS transporter [Sinorhizobium saheli]|uniref:MFS transporter n=1 Tax=Sinorhizobium saheli TaxID=36856 RepID=A0A178YRV3_SINSA|nr:MFS transporter [Sinorhizobium saheli]MQW88239.1 MFS transporter [Sinorhizobium saheli]OAP50194.1 MFS transporter [Sinorhizobium saheli]